MILSIGLKCVNRMTVAMETGQNSRSAPLHPQNTRHSVIATKRSLEFWKLLIKIWNINYFVLFSPVLFRNFLIIRLAGRSLTNGKKTAVVPKGRFLAFQTAFCWP